MMGGGRGKISGRGHEAAEGDGDGVRGGEESVEGSAGNEEEGGDVAVRSLHSCCQSVRCSCLRQESSSQHGPQRPQHRHRLRHHRRRSLYQHLQR